MLATAAAATSILSLSGSNAFAADGNAVAAGSPGVLSGNSVQAPVEVPVNACGNTADVVGAANPTFGNNCANNGSSTHHHASAPARVPTQERTSSSTSGSTSGRADDGPRHSSAPARHTHTRPDMHAGTQSVADGDAVGSPGVGTGNNAKAPADVPVKACGNTVDVIGLLSPAMGNGCDAGAPTPPGHEAPPSGHEAPPTGHETPPRAAAEPPADRAVTDPAHSAKSPRHAASSASGRAPSADSPAPHALAQLAATGSDEDLLAATAASAALLLGGGILYRRGRASSGL
ncbi:chaplin [Streptomyces sp. NPDC055189]